MRARAYECERVCEVGMSGWERVGGAVTVAAVGGRAFVCGRGGARRRIGPGGGVVSAQARPRVGNEAR